VKILQQLQKTSTYYLKDICALWESWISPLPSPSGVAEFKISKSQAKDGWNFIYNLTIIAISESTKETNDTVWYLQKFIHEWRVHATEDELNNYMIYGVGMYLQHYKKLVNEKAETPINSARVKMLEVAVKTGLSLLLQFLAEEFKVNCVYKYEI